MENHAAPFLSIKRNKCDHSPCFFCPFLYFLFPAAIMLLPFLKKKSQEIQSKLQRIWVFTCSNISPNFLLSFSSRILHFQGKVLKVESWNKKIYLHLRQLIRHICNLTGPTSHLIRKAQRL